MIGHLAGKLLHKTPYLSVIDCQGVGYEVSHTPQTAEKLEAHASLFIHSHIREDQFHLFGFLTSDERSLFRELIRVSGIGPKLALSILSGISFSDLQKTVVAKDIKRLQLIPGIGKKTAERICIELADRLKELTFEQPQGQTLTPPDRSRELESVLTNLGYQRTEVQWALKNLPDADPQTPLEVLVKQSLKELAQRRLS